MKSKVQAAADDIRDFIDTTVQDLSQADYKEVLDLVISNLECAEHALLEEMEGA